MTRETNNLRRLRARRAFAVARSSSSRARRARPGENITSTSADLPRASSSHREWTRDRTNTHETENRDGWIPIHENTRFSPRGAPLVFSRTRGESIHHVVFVFVVRTRVRLRVHRPRRLVHSHVHGTRRRAQSNDIRRELGGKSPSVVGFDPASASSPSPGRASPGTASSASNDSSSSCAAGPISPDGWILARFSRSRRDRRTRSGSASGFTVASVSTKAARGAASRRSLA